MLISESLKNKYMEMIRLEDDAQIIYEGAQAAVASFDLSDEKCDFNLFYELCDKCKESEEDLERSRQNRRLFATMILDSVLFPEV